MFIESSFLRRYYRGVAFLAALFVVCGFLPAAEGKPGAKTDNKKEKAAAYKLSIADSVREALLYSYTLRSAKTGVDVARGRIEAAYGEALPVVSTNFSGSRYTSEAQRASTGEDDADLFDSTINIAQPLFKGGKIRAALRGARNYREYVQEDIREVRQNLVYSVYSGYYGLLLAEEFVAVNEGQVALAREALENADARRRMKVATELEVLRARVQLSNEEATLIQSRNNMENARVAFLKLLGLPLCSKLELTERFSYRLESVEPEEVLLEKALKNRAEMKKAELAVEMQQDSIVSLRSGLFPSASLAGSYGGTADNWNVSSGDWEKKWSFGISVDFLIFDGMEIRGQLREQRAVLDQLKLQRSDLADNVRLEVNSALLDLRSAEEFVRSQAANVNHAGKYLKQEETRRKQGASTYLDVLNARQSLAQAQQNYYQALHDLEVARVSLRKAVGLLELQESDVKGYRVSKDGCEDASDCGKSIGELFSAMPAPVSESAEVFCVPGMPGEEKLLKSFSEPKDAGVVGDIKGKELEKKIATPESTSHPVEASSVPLAEVASDLRDYQQ